MSCPHSSAIGSTPDRCSLCIQERGTSKVTVTTIQIKNGIVIENGVSIGRYSDINREKQREETRQHGPAKKRLCGRCGQPGHYRSTCDTPLDSALAADQRNDDFN